MHYYLTSLHPIVSVWPLSMLPTVLMVLVFVIMAMGSMHALYSQTYVVIVC